MPMRLSPKSKARTVCTGCNSGVSRHRAHALRLDPQQSPRPCPTLLVREIEYHAGIDRHRQPRVLAHLAFELSGLPIRVAESNERVRGAFTTRHRSQYVTRG